MVGGLINFSVLAAVPPLSLSCRRSSPLVPNEAGEIVGKIGHADLRRGAGNADGADEEFHMRLLPREDMLDESTDL